MLHTLRRSLPLFAALIFRRPTATALRKYLLVSFAFSAALVGSVLPSRLEPDGNASEVLVPLRAPSAAELAYLMERQVPFDTPDDKPAAEIVAISEDTVILAAHGYLVGDLASRPKAWWVSWEGYVLEHEIERPALEAALGRKLGPGDVHAPRHNGVTYRSRWLVAYVLAEVALLGMLFAVGLTAMAAVRPFWLWPIVALAWSYGVVLLVVWVAPATFDADYFYHRVVIDRLATHLFLLARLFEFDLVGVTMLGAGFDVGRTVASRWKLRSALGGAIGTALAAAGVLGSEWRDYRAAVGPLEAAVDAAVPCVAPTLAAWVRARPPPQDADDHADLASRLDAAFNARTACPSGSGDDPSRYLYVPTETTYAFFALDPKPTFLGLRNLDSSIGGPAVTAMRESGRPLLTPFDAWMKGRVLGRMGELHSGAPLAADDAVVGFLTVSAW